MIKSFKHKGLKKFFETGSSTATGTGIQVKHQRKLRMQLVAITINGNWRVTFEFANGNAYILNYEDNH